MIILPNKTKISYQLKKNKLNKKKNHTRNVQHYPSTVLLHFCRSETENILKSSNHNLLLICLLLHQGQAPAWCVHWWVGEWLSAALHEGAAWCQGDKKGQETSPQSLHTQATICSETLPVRDRASSSQPPPTPRQNCKPTCVTVNMLLTANWSLFSKCRSEKLQQCIQSLVSFAFWILSCSVGAFFFISQIPESFTYCTKKWGFFNVSPTSKNKDQILVYLLNHMRKSSLNAQSICCCF